MRTCLNCNKPFETDTTNADELCVPCAAEFKREQREEELLRNVNEKAS